MMVIDPNSPLNTRLLVVRNNWKRIHLIIAILLTVLGEFALAQRPATVDPTAYGPYNGVFLADGLGLRVPLSNAHDSLLLAESPWSIYCWIRPSKIVKDPQLVAGIGNVSAEYSRFLAISADKV